ncbi:MAG: hypothetical protein ABI651_14455 [Verrucomicrobiota bacterium]
MNRLVLFLSLSLLTNPVLVFGGEVAQARIFCLSLRFQTATTKLFGQSYTLDLATGSTTSPNGELAPLDLEQSVHGSGFILRDPILATDITGSISFDRPPYADENTNGFADFFEVSQHVSTTTTQGTFQVDGDFEEGTVKATWKRDAGSRTGTCTLHLEGSTFGALPDFTHTFELLEYTGTFNYTPGSTNVTGAINLAQSDNPTNTLVGALEFIKVETNRFNEFTLQIGAWTNAAMQMLSFTNSYFQRDLDLNTNYFGLVIFDDGEPTTPEADYRLWILSIDDSNDANGNGIPDFSDDPAGTPARPPLLKLEKAAANLLLSISGEIGKVHEVQEITSLIQTNWTTTLSLTLTNDLQVVQLPLPTNSASFWRVRVP